MADCAGISAGARSTMMAGHPKRALLGDAGNWVLAEIGHSQEQNRPLNKKPSAVGRWA
jgi:hypothetical protein